MSPIEAASQSILSVFAETAWTSKGIKTVPRNFTATNHGPEFVRVSVLAGGRPKFRKSTSGVVQVEIFTESGKGPNRALEIVSALDLVLTYRTVGQTQLFGSSFQEVPSGNEPGYHRGLYTITFSLFEV